MFAFLLCHGDLISLKSLNRNFLARRLNAGENFAEESFLDGVGGREASAELALTPLQCLFMTRFGNFVKDARALLCVGFDGFYGRRVNRSINFLRFYVDCFLINFNEYTAVAKRLQSSTLAHVQIEAKLSIELFPPKPIKARSEKICRPSLESF